MTITAIYIHFVAFGARLSLTTLTQLRPNNFTSPCPALQDYGYCVYWWAASYPSFSWLFATSSKRRR